MNDLTQTSSNPPPTNGPIHDRRFEEDEIDLLELWNTLWSKRIFIAKFTAACTALAVIYALLAPVTYKAEMLLAPADANENAASGLAAQFGGLASLAGVNLGGDQSTEETLAILKSKKFLLGFLNDEKITPILFEDDWNEETQNWNDPKEPPSPEAILGAFHENMLSVSQDKKTQLVSLSVEWTDPAQAAAWANLLVKRLNDHVRKHDIAEAEKSITYLQQQLTTTSLVEVQKSIYTLIENQTKTKMLANTREDYALRVLDPAIEPTEKNKPKRKMIVIIGFLLGGMIAVFTVFIRQFIDNQKASQKEL